MGLKTEIIRNYMDAYGLVSPVACKSTDINTSGNGLMYLSEFLVLCKKRKEIERPEAIKMLVRALKGCAVGPKRSGLYSRTPTNRDQESIDDMYGLCAVMSTYNLWHLGKDMVHYGENHLGYFDNTRPYVDRPFKDMISLIKYLTTTVKQWNGNAFYWRQPQLMCAMYAAAGQAPWFIYPLRAYTALVIATSCMFARQTDADARRLSWLLIQAMTPVSWACRQAAKIWYWRLYRTYGERGMSAAVVHYYEAGHPFVRYWVD